MTDLIYLHISNSQNDVISYDRKLDLNTPIVELKNVLEIVTGVSAHGMQLELYNDNNFVMKIIEQGEHKLLGNFPIQNGMRLHVIGHCTWLDDEGVDKFELSSEQYDSRQDSLRNYLRKNKLGRYNEDRVSQKLAAQARSKEQKEKKLKDAIVGKRCNVMTKCAPSRLGTIAYQGKLEGNSGIFIGVKFDEPVGVNDGTFKGKRYFECAPKYGSFITVDAIEIVDFPPEECQFDDEL